MTGLPRFTWILMALIMFSARRCAAEIFTPVPWATARSGVVVNSTTLTGGGVEQGPDKDFVPIFAAVTPEPEPSPEGLGYTLLVPTPRSRMREFNTDRPDVTESPYTVDAGHFQAEFSFVEYTFNRDRDERTQGFSVMPANLKVGILKNLDIQFVLNPYQTLRTHTAAGSSRDSGFGDMEIRAKLNFWGNDGGGTAFGLLPFIRIPTGDAGLSNHHVEGGLILPFAIAALPGGFDVGTMAEFDIDRNDQNTGYGVDFVHTITIGHPLFFEKLSGYIEYAGVAPIHTGHVYLASFDTGFVWEFIPNVQFDAGINVGLSRRADDYTVFAGLSLRM